MMNHATKQSPEGLPGYRTRRSRMFKMRLTDDEADLLKSAAHRNELSQADYVRFMVYGRNKFAPPNASKLQAICRQLAEIANNLNQAQLRINSAQASGTLNTAQFQAMHQAIGHGLRAWSEPLAELRAELKKLRPNK